MSGDSNGVVVYRTTRLTMIEAVRSAHPAPSGRLRRNKRLTSAELADAILATLPEAEPAPLNPEPDTSIIDAANATIAELRVTLLRSERVVMDLRDQLAERDAEIIRLNGRCDDLFAAVRAREVENAELRAAIDQGADAREVIDAALSTVPGLSQSHGNDQAADVAELVMRYLELGRRGEAAGEENVTLREALAGYAPDPRIAAMKAALERFAAPGVITATDRRKAASDALGAAQGADGEAAP